MKIKLSGLILCLLMLLIALPVQAQDASFTETDCPFNNPTGYDYTCGIVSVPENHLVDNGKTIELAVAVIHSDNPNPEADPVLYLAGGPGAEFVAIAPTMPNSYYFNTLLVDRDVILVDQRGMGLSQPNFSCVPFTGASDAFNLSIEDYQLRMAECIPVFEAQGIDWQAYTSEQNAWDLAMVPGALGYEDYNIFGQSYGTTLGQIMLRDRPEHIRSAVLDSVVPINANYFAESAINEAALFARVEADCKADFACRLAYGNLRQTYVDTYFRLKDDPVILDIAGLEFPVTGRWFVDFVHINMTSRDTVRNAPALITAFAENDLDIVVEFVSEIASRPVEDYPNQALLMTMICPMVAPYTSVDEIIEVHSTVEEPFRNASWNENAWYLCQSWDGVPASNQELASSDVPTLVLSGEYDVLAPPNWGERVADALPESQFVALPYTGHLTNSSSCAQRMIVSFFRNPEEDVNLSCINELDAPGFILHTTVTRPPIQVGAILLSLLALFAVGQMLFSGLSDVRRTAWVMAFKKQGWLPLISLVVLLLLIVSDATVLPDEFVTVGIVQAILPLFMALQAAGAFSPSDEPALEVQMAASRPIGWVLVERLVVIVLTYTGIAIVGIGLTLALNSDQNMPVLLIGWLPPALFLSGLGVYITVRTRMLALGVITSGFLWFVFALFAPMLIPGQPFPSPFNLVQPFLWSIHVHASLNDLTIQDYWLNRLFLSGAGLSLMFFAVRDLLDVEKLLLGVKTKSTKDAKKVELVDLSRPGLKASMTVKAVATRIEPIQQLIGIAKYTFIMRLRTRGWKVFTLTPIAVIGITMFAMGGMDMIPAVASLDSLPKDQQMIAIGELFTAISSAVFFVPAIFMYPILVASIIPEDKTLHVADLMDALPVSYPVAVIGRIAGAVLAGLLSLAITVGVAFGFALYRYGVFTVSPFFDMITGMALAMVFLSATVMLLGATQPDGRRATAIAIVVLILPEVLQATGVIRKLYPGRTNFFLYYIDAAFTNLTFQPLTTRSWLLFSDKVGNLMSSTFLTMCIVAIVVFAWHSYRKNH